MHLHTNSKWFMHTRCKYLLQKRNTVKYFGWSILRNTKISTWIKCILRTEELFFFRLFNRSWEVKSFPVFVLSWKSSAVDVMQKSEQRSLHVQYNFQLNSIQIEFRIISSYQWNECRDCVRIRINCAINYGLKLNLLLHLHSLEWLSVSL